MTFSQAVCPGVVPLLLLLLQPRAPTTTMTPQRRTPDEITGALVVRMSSRYGIARKVAQCSSICRRPLDYASRDELVARPLSLGGDAQRPRGPMVLRARTSAENAVLGCETWVDRERVAEARSTGGFTSPASCCAGSVSA